MAPWTIFLIIVYLFINILIITACSIPILIAVAIKNEYRDYKALPDEEDSETMSKSREACHKLDMGV